MNSLVHAHWGRPLEEYAASYSLELAKLRDTLTEKDIDKAVLAIQKVCRVAAQKGASSEVLNCALEEVSLSTLKAISKLFHDPKTFRYLGRPDLVSGCITLMKTIELRGVSSPFSFEYGYLCFRIMTVALGVALLERSSALEEAVNSMDSETDSALLLLFSGHAANVIADVLGPHEFTILERCNWILGWDNIGKSNGILPLMSIEDARTLLSILWGDRKLYLMALMSTYSPGLSGVMFVLWRYILFERNERAGGYDPDLLVGPICEIYWRSVLVSTSDQKFALTQIGNGLSALSRIWDKSTKIAELEDTRTILKAYQERLAPADTELYAPLDISVLPLLLRFAVPHLVAGSEDLLPRVFELIIVRLWDILVNDEVPDDLLIECTRITYDCLEMVLEYLLHAPGPNQLIILEIVKALINNDFLDFVARVMLKLEPTIWVSSDVREMNWNYWKATEIFFEKLAKLVPRQTLETLFRGYALEWLKFKRHLIILSICLQDPPSGAKEHPYFLHYCACFDAWNSIAKSLGQKRNIDIAESEMAGCGYQRCASVSGIAYVGVPFACGICASVPYCSVDCQARDWIRGGELVPHRALCRKYLQANTAPNPMAELSHLLDVQSIWDS